MLLLGRAGRQAGFSTSAARPGRYSLHYEQLELPDNASRSAVRHQYIKLVKKYHPDHYNDNGEKFSKIDLAYTELTKKFQEDKIRDEAMVGEYGLYYDKSQASAAAEETETDHPDIQHVVPQHRQYLDNPFGSGTPAQRQKQTQKYRAFRANEAVYEHRMGKLTAQYENRVVTAERDRVKQQHTKNQIERLVEDLIQESIASGEFENLAGAGKPLPNRVDYNPFTDFTTHKVNQILVETGFAPEWVQLQKDIRGGRESIRKALRSSRQKLGPAPLNKHQFESWASCCEKLGREDVAALNRMIAKFNLIVPNMNNQMFIFNLAVEAEKAFSSGFEQISSVDTNINRPEIQEQPNLQKEGSSLFSSLFGIFNK